ncbi:uncharacterized protein FIBRA_07537 [Fibroporia radiculosa]|uniref:Uncharacterized protein n=1 Tax=Fibroporia radiculosa TaxID=599839 RepID=J4GET3_9APHY|nr:uncharacterized protein FIBRA_07537 [Fibroporia radiculosa]CCM05323.1 predicted protein [Fibroporia radiculosa]
MVLQAAIFYSDCQVTRGKLSLVLRVVNSERE